ncbi:hypothetical protein HDU76_002336, partial [Blyttiomyces sp. JEL0837]
MAPKKSKSKSKPSTSPATSASSKFAVHPKFQGDHESESAVRKIVLHQYRHNYIHSDPSSSFALYFCIQQYAECITSNDEVKPSQDDITFFKQLEKDTSLGTLIRILAAYTLGLVMYLRGDRQQASKRFRKALSYEKDITLAERNTRILYKLEMAKIGDILPEVMEPIHSCLKELEQYAKNENDGRQDGAGEAGGNNKTSVYINPHSATSNATTIVTLLVLSGRKAPDDLELSEVHHTATMVK